MRAKSNSKTLNLIILNPVFEFQKPAESIVKFPNYYYHDDNQLSYITVGMLKPCSFLKG